MFKLKTNDSKYVHNLYDIATLEDVAIGIFNDEQEAKRIATIAGNMKFQELFITNKWTLCCVKENKR